MSLVGKDPVAVEDSTLTYERKLSLRFTVWHTIISSAPSRNASTMPSITPTMAAHQRSHILHFPAAAHSLTYIYIYTCAYIGSFSFQNASAKLHTKSFIMANAKLHRPSQAERSPSFISNNPCGFRTFADAPPSNFKLSCFRVCSAP